MIASRPIRKSCSWIAGLTNCFLVRDPREVLISLAKVTPNPNLADTGIPQQLDLFRAELYLQLSGLE